MSGIEEEFKAALKNLVDEEHLELATNGAALAAQVMVMKAAGKDTTAHEAALLAVAANLEAAGALRAGSQAKEVALELISVASDVLQQIVKKAIGIA